MAFSSASANTSINGSFLFQSSRADTSLLPFFFFFCISFRTNRGTNFPLFFFDQFPFIDSKESLVANRSDCFRLSELFPRRSRSKFKTTLSIVEETTHQTSRWIFIGWNIYLCVRNVFRILHQKMFISFVKQCLFTEREENGSDYQTRSLNARSIGQGHQNRHLPISLLTMIKIAVRCTDYRIRSVNEDESLIKTFPLDQDRNINSKAQYSFVGTGWL